MKKLLLYGLISIFVSCSNDDNGDGEEVFEPYSIDSQLIGHGLMHGRVNMLPEQYNVVYNSEQWNDLIQTMDSQNVISDSFLEIDVNFNDYQIIVAIDKVRSGNGWSVDIMDIVAYENEIFVTIINLNTGGYADNSLYRPFHIVKIPKSDKPVVFERIYPED